MIELGSSTTKIFCSYFCSQRARVLPDLTSWNMSSEKESAKMEETVGWAFLSVIRNLLMLQNACFKSSNPQNVAAVVTLSSPIFYLVISNVATSYIVKYFKEKKTHNPQILKQFNLYLTVANFTSSQLPWI